MADPAPAGRVLAQRPLRPREAPSFAPTVSERRPLPDANRVIWLDNFGRPLGGNNGRATDRLDRSYHHWWNCRLARRAVHEEPNGAGDEHRARHHWGRCRQLAVRLPRYLVWRLDWL